MYFGKYIKQYWRCFESFFAKDEKKKLIHSEEASYFDGINMTENGLDFDRKIFIPTNLNIGT